MKKEDILNSGRRVLKLESYAIGILAEKLSSAFSDSVELLYGCKGKIIVSGIGKSGNIAQKIAATFSSTGSPAQFIHPAEASHGDLGNISPGDITLILSNSGETKELHDIISFCKKASLPIIGISASSQSTLSENSTISLTIPNIGEACPNGLAPTTSTTLMLGLGDALCVALMEKKGFSKKAFSEFHPGGKLGALLKPVSTIMHVKNSMPLINEKSKMSDALLEMTKKGFGITGVVSNSGNLTGVISDGDLRRNMEDLLNKSVVSVMTKSPIILDSSTNVSDTLSLMNESKITSIFISTSKKSKIPKGIVHVHDCLRLGNR